MTKLLIVEDDTTLAKMYQKKFAIAGYEVAHAPDGEEGLAAMRSFAPDMVLMDLMMPKMDGMAALERAKADPALKNIPIVMLTNLSTAQDVQHAVLKGALGYIVKSDFTPAEVVEKVQAFLASPKSPLKEASQEN